jgi:hypothetical protein
LDTTNSNEGESSIDIPESPIDEHEIELVKKASRAFAVTYVNEIYNTIKSIEPSALEKFEIIKQYPCLLYLFIYQNKSGEIEQLDIFSEQKYCGDGLSEVKEIYHSSEFGSSFINNKKKKLANRCNNWHWSSLKISKMFMMATYGGRRVGRSIYNQSRLKAPHHHGSPPTFPMTH